MFVLALDGTFHKTYQRGVTWRCSKKLKNVNLYKLDIFHTDSPFFTLIMDFEFQLSCIFNFFEPNNPLL